MAIATVLFAAGRARRLRPLSDMLPKATLPVLDVPLAGISLPRLRRAHPPVVVNVSGRVAVFRAALTPFMPPERVELFVEHPEPLGTAGTLGALRPRLAARVLTWNADLLTDLDPVALLDAHERAGAAATAAVQPVARGADLRAEAGHAVALLDRRRTPGEPGCRFMGAAVFERAELEPLPLEPPAGLTEAILRPLVARGALAISVHDGYALDVGTFDRYLRANLDALHGRAPEPERGWPGRVVALPDGRAYVGREARVGGDLGPDAVLLSRSALDHGASATRAVVLPGERVPEGVRLSDEVFFAGRRLTAARPR